ncbi:MAG: CdaR family protein [Tissierellales bacterium]
MNKAKRNNITIRIVAIIIAFFMWTYVMNKENPRTTQDIPNIQVVYLNQNYLSDAELEIMEPTESKVTVKLGGRRSDLKTINPNDIIVQADLYGYQEGMNRVPVEVNVPENVTVESVSPQYIQLKLDSIITKEFKIALRTTGKPENGHTQGVGDVRPSTVLIKGPRTWVNSIDDVVATLDLTNVNTDIKTSRPVRVLNDKGEEVRNIQKEPGTVEITVPILGTKNIPVMPRVKGTPLEGYSITDIQINPSSINVKGRKEIIKDIEFFETEPIDVEAINKTMEVPIKIVLPRGIELMDQGLRPLATINVEQIIERNMEFETSKITFINLDIRHVLDKTNLPDKISVTVKGTQSRVDALTDRDVTLYCDLSGLEKGDHSVNLKVILHEDLELVLLEPETVQVTIQGEEF